MRILDSIIYNLETIMNFAQKVELLSDPLHDRKVKLVTPPPHRHLPSDLFYQQNKKPNWQLIQGHLYKQGRISKQDFLSLIRTVAKLFQQEANCLEIKDPVTVVGDIHGQYFDLVKILELGGSPQGKKYLFLGDYVDRGNFSVEVIVLLYAIKANYPKTFSLLRGNHQSRQMTSFFNFRQEVLYKYDQDIYNAVMESFDRMPLASVLNQSFFTVHGGISPQLKTIQALQTEDRRRQPGKEGIICDLLWADPLQKQGRFIKGYMNNQTRGCSYFFNQEAVKNFLEKNKLVSVIRAHQTQIEGYKMHWPKPKGLPLTITIFSAPNYCDCYNNKGAIINFKNNIVNIKQFNYSQHPFILPNFMNLFEWSLPFVAQKVSAIFLKLLKAKLIEEKAQPDFEMIRKKVRAVSRILAIHAKKSAENEVILQKKGMCPDNRLPLDIPVQYVQGKVQEHFEKILSIDSINQMIPQ